jgi:hypothetical protein
MPTYYAPGERTAAVVDVGGNNTARVQLMDPIRVAAAAAAARRNKKQSSRARGQPSVASPIESKKAGQSPQSPPNARPPTNVTAAPLLPNARPPTSVAPPQAAVQATAAALSASQSSAQVSNQVQQARADFDASLKRLFPQPSNTQATTTQRTKAKRPTEHLSSYRNLAALRSPQNAKARRRLPIRPADAPAILHDGSGMYIQYFVCLCVSALLLWCQLFSGA